MKGKHKFFIYAIMIALSLSVMFYGVYAASSASVTVSGKLSFSSHNSTGTAQLVSVTGALNADGSSYTLASADTANIVSWENGNLSFTNALYFDDISTRNPETGDYLDENVKIKPIVITLKMTNTSSFGVKIVAGSATLQTNEATPVDITGVTYSYGALNLTKTGTTGATNSAYAITITPSNTLATLSATGFSLSLSIEKDA